MAVDLFLELEGVKGESKDSAHAEKIELMSWSFAASQQGSMGDGGGGGAGKAMFQDLNVQKYVDAASPALWQHLTAGKHFATGKMIQRKAGGEKLEYFIIELKKVLLSSISTGGGDGDDRLVESLSLNFEEFKISYTPQKDDGTGDAAIEFAWNIAENVLK